MKKLKFITSILLVMLLCGTTFADRFGDVYHEVQVKDEVGVKVTAISSVEIYAPSSTTDAVIYKDRNRTNTITLPMTISSDNTTLIGGVFSWWGPSDYAYSITDGNNVIGTANHRNRNASEGTIIFPSYIVAISSTAYLDGATATFGTSLDWVAEAGTNDDRMTWTPATDSTSAIWIGNTSFTADLNLWGASSAQDMMWDASLSQLSFRDSAVLGFGGSTGGAATDFDIYHVAASSILTITAVAADETVHFGDGTTATDVLFQNTTTAGADVHWDDSEEEWNFGADNTGVDVKFWGDGTGNYILWDESLDTLVCVDGNIKLDDDAIVYYGTGTNVTTADGDFTANFTDGSPGKLVFTATVANDQFVVGSGSIATDFVIDNIVVGNDVWFDQAGDGANGIFYFGIDATGVDVYMYGTTTAERFFWDSSADLLDVIGNKVTLLSTSTSASGIDIEVDGGASSTLHLHADTGTAQNSLDFVSDVGGATFTNSAVPDGQKGVVMAGTLGGATFSEGLGAYVSGTIASNADGKVYALGAWLDITSGTPTDGPDSLLAALDIGIYAAAAPELGASQLRVLNIEYQVHTDAAPVEKSSMMHFNADTGGDVPDYWFTTGNAPSIMYTAETTHSSPNKVGAIKINIGGVGDMYIYCYSDTGN